MKSKSFNFRNTMTKVECDMGAIVNNKIIKIEVEILGEIFKNKE